MIIFQPYHLFVISQKQRLRLLLSFVLLHLLQQQNVVIATISPDNTDTTATAISVSPIITAKVISITTTPTTIIATSTEQVRF